MTLRLKDMTRIQPLRPTWQFKRVIALRLRLERDVLGVIRMLPMQLQGELFCA